jgi:hypothetical protein
MFTVILARVPVCFSTSGSMARTTSICYHEGKLILPA